MQNFDTIYTEHYPKVLSWIKYKINNVEQAEELTSDIFVKIYKNLNEFDENKSKIGTWIMSITKNAIIDFFRTNKSSLNISMSDMVDDDGNETFVYTDNSTPQKELEKKELGEIINSHILSLENENQQIVLDAFLNDQLSYEEISASMDIPIGTVKATIHRAKENLKKRLLNL